MKTFALATIAALAEAGTWKATNSAATGANKFTSYFENKGAVSAKDLDSTMTLSATSTVDFTKGANEAIEVAACWASLATNKSDCLLCSQ